MRVEGPKEHLKNMGCVVEDHILCMASHNSVVLCANADLTSVLRSHFLKSGLLSLLHLTHHPSL